MSRLARGAACRASGAWRPSPAGSPPPHRSGCPGWPGALLPAAPRPGLSTRPELGFFAGSLEGVSSHRGWRDGVWGDGRRDHSPRPGAGQVSFWSPLPFRLSVFGFGGFGCGRSWCGDWRVQPSLSRAARQRAAQVRSLPRGDGDLCELGWLGLLMKCSLRRRSRRGPAVGAPPPARNNNAAEVQPTRGALPAAADVSIQRAPRAAEAVRGSRSPDVSARPERQGAGWGGCAPDNVLPTRRPKVPKHLPQVRQFSPSGQTKRKTWTTRASWGWREQLSCGHQIRLHVLLLFFFSLSFFSFEPLTEGKIPFGACSWSWGK